MAITDHDRRVLWARAHNRCALCRRTLVADASSAGDRESVLGEEAHIVAHSPLGPRGEQTLDHGIDSYENLILLCRDDHRMVDDQPKEHPAHRLRRIKAEHERWAEERFGDALPPVRLREDPEWTSFVLTPLRSGREVWDLLTGTHAYRLSAPDESEASDDQCDLADTFLDLVKDWGEISDEIADRGPTRIRETVRSLDEALLDLTNSGLMAFGGRRRLILEGGVGPSTHWWELMIKVAPPN